MINADPQELAKFGELAHRWWDPESEFKPLHQINPLRLEWINSLCPLSGKSVLDVGCGGGILTDSMARRGAHALGIDLSTKPLKVAQLHAMEAGTENVDYREIAVEALAAERPASFDAVTCMEMLEHVPDPASVVRALGTLVKPGGWVFLSTLNRNFKSFMLAIVGAEYVLKMLPAGNARIRPFPEALGTGPVLPRCRPGAAQQQGPDLQPAEPALQARPGHRRELPAGLPQAAVSSRREICAVLFDLDGTLIDSAPDLSGAANDMLAARGLPTLPYEALRPMCGSGARGMLGTAFGIAPGHRDFEALKQEFLDIYEARMTRETRVFAEVAAMLSELTLPWGIVTNKAERFALPLTDALGLRTRSSSVATRPPTPSRTPRPCSKPRAGPLSRPGFASTSATTNATSSPAMPPAC